MIWPWESVDLSEPHQLWSMAFYYREALAENNKKKKQEESKVNEYGHRHPCPAGSRLSNNCALLKRWHLLWTISMLFCSDSFSNFSILMTTPSVDKGESLLWDNPDPYPWYTEEQVSKELSYRYRARASYKICGAQLKIKMLTSYSRGRVKSLPFLLWSLLPVMMFILFVT